MQNDRQTYYHLYCNRCGADWWMNVAFPAYCPFCGDERQKISNKTCHGCKHLHYNDIWGTICYKGGCVGCEDWEADNE